jgi:hypothetical protein
MSDYDHHRTGAGLPDAESFASIAAADARCAVLGLTTWAALSTPAKEIALRKAMIFMSTYRMRWAGRRVYQHQALDWPGYGVVVDGFPVPSNIVPVDVANACIDLAVRAGSGEDLLPDLDTASGAGKQCLSVREARCLCEVGKPPDGVVDTPGAVVDIM